MRLFRSSAIVAAGMAALILGTATRTFGAVAEPAPREDDAFDLMNLLAHRGVHDLTDEDWNAYGQVTDIWSFKPGFSARYTNYNGSTNSLLPTQELSFTETATLYLAARLWDGGEAYLVPEMIGERPLSSLRGLGGVIQNFELQKNGSTVPTPYLSRVYLRQTIGLGGADLVTESDPHVLGRIDKTRRLVLTAGNLSVIDIFDANAVAGDLRRSFLNMSFLTYAAYDFAADARGYSWGGVAELFWDDWRLRFGRFTPPKDPNQLALDFHLDKVYGDQVEVGHHHRILGEDGVVRVLGYRNVENMGKFSDAISAYEANHLQNATTCTGFNYGSNNSTAPDLCWARRSNVKIGAGIAVEQNLSEDLGLFARGMYSDGQTEVYSYTSTDSSVSVGGVLAGRRWKRPLDTVGTGWSQGWISRVHAQYLGMGGIDGFIGDGKIKQASEGAFEVYYRLALGSSAWLTGDYQHIWNPGYNGDRGPAEVFGGRIHVEF